MRGMFGVVMVAAVIAVGCAGGDFLKPATAKKAPVVENYSGALNGAAVFSEDGQCVAQFNAADGTIIRKDLDKATCERLKVVQATRAADEEVRSRQAKAAAKAVPAPAPQPAEENKQ